MGAPPPGLRDSFSEQRLRWREGAVEIAIEDSEAAAPAFIAGQQAA